MENRPLIGNDPTRNFQGKGDEGGVRKREDRRGGRGMRT